MQPMLSNIIYRTDGQMLSAEYGNGVAELREYDLQGRLVGKELIDNAGFIVEERTWTYDPAGNVVERTQSSATETFSYDPLDRLVGQDITGASNASWSYDYGPNHNRLSRQLVDEFDEGYDYETQSNRLLRRTRPTPASSPLDGIYQRKSSYNQAGRLSAYSENGDIKARYTYNTFGLRTRKETDAGTKAFHYDTGITLLGESDEAGNTTRDYIWFNGSPVATVDAAGTVAWIHTDHLFTPRLATDPTGTIVWSWEGEAFGDAEPSGSLTLNLRFPGQYFDAESGRHYNVMRDYDTALGRYMQSDPIGLAGRLNLFLYGGANPLLVIDPDGRIGVFGAIAIGAGITGLITGAISFKNGNGFANGFIGGAGAVFVGVTIGFVGLGGGALGTVAGSVFGLGLQSGVNAITVGSIIDTGNQSSNDQLPNAPDGTADKGATCP